ncbi:MAG: rRNA ((1498)-N(3))-methyltransferase, partial [Variovorax sp.]|nr:rRNA ((1498)-N(3))-methyltransferase [Variovorax sp.]
AAWLASVASIRSGADAADLPARLVLSLADGTRSAADMIPTMGIRDALVLSGPEGGLSASEEMEAIGCGFAPTTLGSRVLRAETAALAALMWWSDAPGTR